MKTYILEVNPCTSPRMTQRDKWAKRPCVLRYRQFKDNLRQAFVDEGLVLPKSNFAITFYIKMPKTWSKKKKEKMELAPHEQKPDIDNFLKSFLDASFKEDCGVYQIDGLGKYWTKEEGYILIRC